MPLTVASHLFSKRTNVLLKIRIIAVELVNEVVKSKSKDMWIKVVFICSSSIQNSSMLIANYQVFLRDPH